MLLHQALFPHALKRSARLSLAATLITLVMLAPARATIMLFSQRVRKTPESVPPSLVNAIVWVFDRRST